MKEVGIVFHEILIMSSSSLSPSIPARVALAVRGVRWVGIYISGLPFMTSALLSDIVDLFHFPHA